MHPDGRAFYYADYNFKGKKVYSDHGFPCCSGTLPQVATDYRINTYFRDPLGVFVNLYIPSRVGWVQDGGARVSLIQKGAYPFESTVHFDVLASVPVEFSLNLRIPGWAEGARIELNGKRFQGSLVPGTFASIHRRWKTGDRVELELPMKNRLEPIDSRHRQTVALLYGPMVLFAITMEQPALTRTQLLSATQTGRRYWEVNADSGPMKMLPYVVIDEEQYSTYFNVT